MYSVMPRSSAVVKNFTDGCEGKRFTVGVVENMLFDLEMENGTVINSIGYEFNLLRALATMLKFKFRIEGNTNYEFGNQLENKSWTGVIGRLQRKEIDFALAGLTITSDRMMVSDFSHPYFNDEAAFYVRSNTVMHQLRVFCLIPFDKNCWIFMTAIGCVFFLLTLISNKERSKIESILFLYSSLLRQSAEVFGNRKISLNSRLLTILRIWLIITAVVTTLYGCELTSSTTTFTPNLIETLSQLSKKFENRELVLGVRKGAFYMDYVVNNAEASQYGSVFRKAVRPVGGFDTYSKGLLEGTLSILTSGKLFSLYMSGKGLGRKVYKVKEALFTEYVGIAFVKNFSYQSRFNFGVASLRETGLLLKWEQTLLSKARENVPSFTNSGFIGLKDLKSSLFLWSFGIGIAVLIALKETCLDKQF